MMMLYPHLPPLRGYEQSRRGGRRGRGGAATAAVDCSTDINDVVSDYAFYSIRDSIGFFISGFIHKR